MEKLKRNRKGFVVSAGALLVVALLSLMVVAVASSDIEVSKIYKSIIQPENCADTPYNDDCFCPAGFNKYSFKWTGLTKYVCEPENLKFDPNDPAIPGDLIAHARTYLAENYENCDAIACTGDKQQLNAGIGQMKDGRYAVVECMDYAAGVRWWEAKFDIYTGNIIDSSCISYVEPISTGTTPATFELEPDEIRYSYGYMKKPMYYTAHCGEIDNGIATATIYAPEDIPMREWVVTTGGWNVQYDTVTGLWSPVALGGLLPSGTCSIIESDANHAKVQCDIGCPNMEIKGYLVNVFGLFDENYLNNNYCKFDTKYYSVGDKVCCNDDRVFHICNSDLSWAKDTSGLSSCKSSVSKCPAS